MSARLGGWDLLVMAARASLLQATWNYERQQGIGWAWALEPALRKLYPDPALRAERLAEHTAYFNTQPTLASVALGAVARIEEQRALGTLADEAVIPRAKALMGSALAAVGDRLFWFTLRPFAACLGVLLALGGSWIGALALWMCYNAVHLTVRLRGVAWAHRQGPDALAGGLRGRLERAVRTVSDGGAALVGVLVAALLVPGGSPQSLTFQATLSGGLALGLLTAQRARPTPTHWALGAGALCLAAAWIR